MLVPLQRREEHSAHVKHATRAGALAVHACTRMRPNDMLPKAGDPCGVIRWFRENGGGVLSRNAVGESL